MPPSQPTSTHLPAADGIRGLACLIVLLLHGISFCWPAAVPWLRGGGKYGVWLFFVLSAFLLTLRLQQRGFGWPSLSDYALGRCLRILPLFALACLLHYWAGVGILTGEQLFASLTLQQGYSHLWTIPVEFKFYLLLPPLVWAGLALYRRWGAAGLLPAAAALLAAQQSLWPYWLTPENSALTRWYLPSFMFGILAALLLPALRNALAQRLATPFALVTLAVLCLGLPGARLLLAGMPLSDDLMNKHLYLSLLWAVFILLLVDGHGLVGRWLCSRPMRFLGNVSYSTYLFHILVMLPLATRWPGNPLILLLATVLAVAAGAAGYYLAERPLEHLRKRLAARQALAAPCQQH